MIESVANITIPFKFQDNIVQSIQMALANFGAEKIDMENTFLAFSVISCGEHPDVCTVRCEHHVQRGLCNLHLPLQKSLA